VFSHFEYFLLHEVIYSLLPWRSLVVYSYQKIMYFLYVIFHVHSYMGDKSGWNSTTISVADLMLHNI
jgi:hypothetical protein